MAERTLSGDGSLHDAIGNTVDALLRPRTPLPASGVLRVADLYSAPAGLGDAARDAGLEVVYAHLPGDAVGDISDRNLIPPFDILTANLLGDGREEALAFALRFLRVRRPVAFVLADVQQADLGPAFPQLVQDKTRRLGYRVDGRQCFVVGALRQEPFAWPAGKRLALQTLLEWLVGTVLEHAGD